MTFRRLAIVICVGIALGFGCLIIGTLQFVTLSNLPHILADNRLWHAIFLSISIATTVSVAALALGLPAGYALSRYTFRFQTIIDTLLELPLVVSPVALGAMLLMTLSTPFGIWAQAHSVTLTLSIGGIFLAQFVTVIGLAIRLVKTAMDEIPKRFDSSARSLGATEWQAFSTVVLPMARRGLSTAFILTWAKALGEFGATVTLAGATPYLTETLPIAISLRLSVADISGTAILILVLLALGLTVLFGLKRLKMWHYA